MKQQAQEETDKLIDIREEFYAFLDESLAKNKHGGFDFSKTPSLDAKKVYEHFFKLDYQARKLRGLLVKTYDLKAE